MQNMFHLVMVYIVLINIEDLKYTSTKDKVHTIIVMVHIIITMVHIITVVHIIVTAINIFIAAIIISIAFDDVDIIPNVTKIH